MDRCTVNVIVSVTLLQCVDVTVSVQVRGGSLLGVGGGVLVRGVVFDALADTTIVDVSGTKIVILVRDGVSSIDLDLLPPRDDVAAVDRVAVPDRLNALREMELESFRVAVSVRLDKVIIAVVEKESRNRLVVSDGVRLNGTLGVPDVLGETEVESDVLKSLLFDGEIENEDVAECVVFGAVGVARVCVVRVRDLGSDSETDTVPDGLWERLLGVTISERVPLWDEDGIKE